jgi:hypothetical protein
LKHFRNNVANCEMRAENRRWELNRKPLLAVRVRCGHRFFRSYVAARASFLLRNAKSHSRGVDSVLFGSSWMSAERRLVRAACRFRVRKSRREHSSTTNRLAAPP